MKSTRPETKEMILGPVRTDSMTSLVMTENAVEQVSVQSVGREN